MSRMLYSMTAYMNNKQSEKETTVISGNASAQLSETVKNIINSVIPKPSEHFER